MNAERTYLWLMKRRDVTAHDAFDLHVIASILALALSEGSACMGTGLDAGALEVLVEERFPGSGVLIDNARVEIDEEERSVRDILMMYAGEGGSMVRALTAMIARRCSRPHHLWQDLGLRNRTELSALMTRHFPGLARRNANDMKWKKFLYRMVCRSEGFSLCTAPVCSDCDDFARCFGAEDGESLMARLRNGVAA